MLGASESGFKLRWRAGHDSKGRCVEVMRRMDAREEGAEALPSHRAESRVVYLVFRRLLRPMALPSRLCAAFAERASETDNHSVVGRGIKQRNQQ